jgi:SAM-dependent methyltransferase
MGDADGNFDEGVAATYDESSADMFEPAVVEPTVDFLAERAGPGRALELGIGTGRIALRLVRRGVDVHGIELSTAMAARLRVKNREGRGSKSRSGTSRRRRRTGRSGSPISSSTRS